MIWYKSFGAGVAGAFVVYSLLYRNTRFKTLFQKEPGHKWQVLFFDVVVYLLCGALVAMFLTDPLTTKEAFIGGCAWEGLAGGAMAGTELKTLRNYTAKTKKK